MGRTGIATRAFCRCADDVGDPKPFQASRFGLPANRLGSANPPIARGDVPAQTEPPSSNGMRLQRLSFVPQRLFFVPLRSCPSFRMSMVERT